MPLSNGRLLIPNWQSLQSIICLNQSDNCKESFR